MSNSNTELFTASDLARFCQVDLKTIHNWADKGDIPHFRTPGRHLRFRRLHVLDFLRKYGYPVPAIVSQLGTPGAHGKPTVVLIEPVAARVPELIEKLKSLFEVRTFVDVNMALLAMGAAPPEALVLDANNTDPWVIRSLQATDATSHTRCVIYSDPSLEHLAARVNAHAFVKRGDLDGLKDALRRVLGAEHAAQ